MDADFLIQAGHQGKLRNSGSGSTASYGTSGGPSPYDDEYLMTPIVADEAARLLRSVGYSVIREDALFDKKYSVQVGVALHFDGNGTPCASGASIGYPAGSPAGSNKPVADLWRAAYYPHIPFNSMPDNFSANLSGYYGYAYMSTSIAEFLIEFGELTCPEQNEWLYEQAHNGYLARMVAHVLDKAVGGNKIPHPGAPPTPVVVPEPTPVVVPAYDDSEVRAALASLTASLSLASQQAAVAQARAESAHARLDKLRDV